MRAEPAVIEKLLGDRAAVRCIALRLTEDLIAIHPPARDTLLERLDSMGIRFREEQA
jgi:hypothetical protein